MLRDLHSLFHQSLHDVDVFCETASGLKLRSYQQEVARRVVLSVMKEQGDTIVVVFPRQSGKNEVQAQIEAYLLTCFSRRHVEIVKVSPTWRPQTQNAMRRLLRVLERNLYTQGKWQKESGYIIKIGNARVFFLSGSPETSVVGATASLLLECDEAQDIEIAKWDKDFSPMAASTNATRVFWGTMWTSKTLLAREMQAARAAEAVDGRKRVYLLTAKEVAQEVPAYGNFVTEQVARLGRNHPLVKTQYYSETIDAEGSLFSPARLALMRGDHPRRYAPEPGKVYCLLLDVAGEDENKSGDPAALSNSGRDSTALTIVEVDLAALAQGGGTSIMAETSVVSGTCFASDTGFSLKAPTYRVMNRRSWVGVRHTQLYGEILAIAGLWKPAYLVVDATGVGAGLASFLERALPGKVIPFVFTVKSKSDLGFRFLAICDTGRFKDHLPNGDSGCVGEQAEFWRQLQFVEYQAAENQSLKWSVPDGTRDPANGDLVHDDLVLSAALTGVLDEQEWSVSGPAVIISARDPLRDMDSGF